jgi:predicted transcriptional regulator
MGESQGRRQHRGGQTLVRDAIESGGCATMRDVATVTGLALSTVHFHVNRLMNEGIVKRGYYAVSAK